MDSDKKVGTIPPLSEYNTIKVYKWVIDQNMSDSRDREKTWVAGECTLMLGHNDAQRNTCLHCYALFTFSTAIKSHWMLNQQC